MNRREGGGAATGAADPQRPRGERRRAAIAGALLLLAVGLVFGRTVGHEFVNYDDQLYVYENPVVADGLSAKSVGWAFTQRNAANWHPLTWLSHLLDAQLYGLEPGGHHLTSVLLHAAAAIALLLLLQRLTGRLWPSAFAAALFALHPLRVESVAWVAERKDVLSGLLFVLALGAYARYAKRPFSPGRYLAVLLLYALGLMAKPMLVTLPLVLLLLDWWPLGRMGPAAAQPLPDAVSRGAGGFSIPRRLVWEKLPLLALSAASSAVTLWAQQGALMPAERLPFAWRLGNALVAHVAYLGQFVRPLGLAVFYPHPQTALAAGRVALAAAALLVVTWAALAWWRRHPWLLVGWLWNLGMLVPVIGLVQVGRQGMADRYTYLPQIGLGLALAWMVASAPRLRARPRLVFAAALAWVVLLAVLAWRQTGLWRDSETLFASALARTSGNFIAHANLGDALYRRGRAEEAIAQYRKALELKPYLQDTHNNLGTALATRGRLDEAIEHYRLALAIRPDYDKALTNLGNALAARGRTDEAIARYREALAVKPDSPETHNNLGVVLAGRGRVDEAVVHYRQALAIRPDYANAHNNLGQALDGRGDAGEALAHYRTALDLAVRQGREGLAAEVRARLATGGPGGAAPRTPPAGSPPAGR